MGKPVLHNMRATEITSVMRVLYSLSLSSGDHKKIQPFFTIGINGGATSRSQGKGNALETKILKGSAYCE